LPSKEAPGLSNSAIGAGALTLLALAAIWYWMRQNAKAEKQPTGETYKRQLTTIETKNQPTEKTSKRKQANIEVKKPLKQKFNKKDELKMLLMENMSEIEAKQKDYGNEIRRDEFIKAKVKSIKIYLEDLGKIDSDYVKEYKEKFLDNTGITIDKPSTEPTGSNIGPKELGVSRK